MEKDYLLRRAVLETDSVFRFAFHLCGAPDAAADLTEQTYARAVGAGPPAALAEHGVKTWLLRLLYDLYALGAGEDVRGPTPFERVQQEAARDAAFVDVAGTCPACYDLSALNWAEVGDRLARAADALPRAYRAIFFLWSVEGLRYDQVSDVVGLPLGTVRTRLYRARMNIAADLGELATEWELGAGGTRR